MEFSTAVRGFHYYKTYWIPTENECLDCSHEKENPYDYFAITCKKDGMIVGHLPMEISHPTKCLLDRGARITATLTSTSYYASPLVQGGLEIPCLLKIFMPRTVKNTQIISMYEKMIETLYQEKDGRPVVGSILNCCEETEPRDSERKGTKRKRTVGKSSNEDKVSDNVVREKSANCGKDIRSFFKPVSKTKTVIKSKPSTAGGSIIVLD